MSPAVRSLPLPLEGVRVLDVSQVMAGPFCSMLLGDLGADVIKVEPPAGGDQTRGSMGFKMKGGDSMGFLNMNRNKRSVALNLKNDAGRMVFLRLVESADILVENYRPGVMRKLGLDYETLAKIRPELVYASISGFGQDGPWSDRPGFDLMAQAMSGIMSVTGHPGGAPAKAGVPVADIGCALFAPPTASSSGIHRPAEKAARASTSMRRCSTAPSPSRSGTSPSTGAQASHRRRSAPQTRWPRPTRR